MAVVIDGNNGITTPTSVFTNSSGDVGIGTSTPAYKLQTTDQVYFGTSGGTTQIRLGNNTTTNYWSIGRENVTTGDLVFQAQTTERMRIDANGQMRTTNGAGVVALAYDCRAWVNFNGTGTVAIRASGNVSSITDGGVGTYTVNFTTAMPDVNYSVQIPGATGNGFARAGVNAQSALAVGSVLVTTAADNGAAADREYVSVAIFR